MKPDWNNETMLQKASTYATQVVMRRVSGRRSLTHIEE